jgi:hypothetical protein
MSIAPPSILEFRFWSLDFGVWWRQPIPKSKIQTPKSKIDDRFASLTGAIISGKVLWLMFRAISCCRIL